ncbi:hypothetical protein AV530_002471 [Patagioenas fasciata monilis]|uniref:Uncharacterized protein n=1 Tax=Patagioenas fasciata monilis TaxID=372326 RepID=A0A1V4K6N8_PATFA|nr:hypothetical protein AV530_002471 [Patagioenas fasciata monilis]
MHHQMMETDNVLLQNDTTQKRESPELKLYAPGRGAAGPTLSSSVPVPQLFSVWEMVAAQNSCRIVSSGSVLLTRSFVTLPAFRVKSPED